MGKLIISFLTAINVFMNEVGGEPFSQAVRKFSMSSRVTLLPSTEIMLKTTGRKEIAIYQTGN